MKNLQQLKEEAREEFDLLFSKDENTGWRRYPKPYNADLCCESDNCPDNCGESKRVVIKDFVDSFITKAYKKGIEEGIKISRRTN
jgi:hypothetical protein